LVTREPGPVASLAASLGFRHRTSAFPRFRKIWEKPRFWNDCRRLAASLEAWSPELVLSNEWVTAPHALAVARHLRIPAMSYVRDFEALRRGRKYQLHRMERLQCVCEEMRQGLIGAGYDPARVFTVYNPISNLEITAPDEAALARISGASGVDCWLLYLGRISKRKSQVEAVKTLRLLREKSGRRWGLLLAGDAEEDYPAELDREVAAQGLQDAVVRLGLVAKPGWLFELAEASILTSRSEGLARVLIESFLGGKPAFAYPIEGLADVYGDALPFFVAERRDPGELADRITAALQDREALARQTAALRALLEQRHSTAGHLAAFERALRG
jgi:glycosyltransferase involved in cell wall biosynthesis